MKNQILGIFFYLVYLLAMVRPLVPIIEYHANYDYIATVLCENRDKPYLECNGKCYLEKQLKKADHTNHDHKSTVPQINLKDYPILPVDEFTYTVKDFRIYSSTQFFTIEFTSQDFYNSIFKPPQVSTII
ncbi:hypothetical protein [Lutibacter sp.]